ncbi:RNA polymerase sigma factor [Streptomyces sp. NPDC101175]|uniref:RNA polymerase sigma factor n=1 Tax=Streptomyces sp. NPDC101175 TaxID=3366123 RepID=UPI003838CA01
MADLAMPAHRRGTPAEQLNERFTAIYTQHQARIARLVRSQVRLGATDLADDLTADTFTAAWVALHQCKATTDAQMYGWLAAIARRRVADHYRLARNTRETPVDTGHWSIANSNLTPAASGTLAPIRTGRQVVSGR